MKKGTHSVAANKNTVWAGHGKDFFFRASCIFSWPCTVFQNREVEVKLDYSP